MITVKRAQVKEKGVQITAGSGWGNLEPTWTMVMAYKKRKITEAQYLAEYKSRLQRVSRATLKRLISAAEDDKLTITCYCRDGQFCHTYYILKWLSEHPVLGKYFEVDEDQREFVEGCDWEGRCWERHF